MAGKRDKPKDIALKFRQVEVLHGQGMATADEMRQALGVTARRALLRRASRRIDEPGGVASSVGRGAANSTAAISLNCVCSIPEI